VPRPRLVAGLEEEGGARAGPRLRPGRIRQDCPAGRLGSARRPTGGL